MLDFGGAPLPAGFTPDTLQSYYKSLTDPIDLETMGARGRARGDALSRGLEGTPTEMGGVAAADYYGGLRKDRALGDIAFRMAGLGNENQQAKLGREFQHDEAGLQRSWQSDEAALGRKFQQDESRHQLGEQNRMGYQSALWNLPGQVAGVATGIGLLSKFAKGGGGGGLGGGPNPSDFAGFA